MQIKLRKQKFYYINVIKTHKAINHVTQMSLGWISIEFSRKCWIWKIKNSCKRLELATCDHVMDRMHSRITRLYILLNTETIFHQCFTRFNCNSSKRCGKQEIPKPISWKPNLASQVRFLQLNHFNNIY